MENKKYKFYFDMDGVLANFNAHAPKCASDTNRPSDQLNETARIAKRQMWQTIESTDDFWHNLPITGGIESVLDSAQNIAELFVLSKTPNPKNFVNGEKYIAFIANEKRDWIARNMGNYFDADHVIICAGKKGEFISPSQFDILVDDRIDNINEWCESGGHGIHFMNVQDTCDAILNKKFM